jgi:hypothetical protein
MGTAKIFEQLCEVLTSQDLAPFTLYTRLDFVVHSGNYVKEKHGENAGNVMLISGFVAIVLQCGLACLAPRKRQKGWLGLDLCRAGLSNMWFKETMRSRALRRRWFSDDGKVAITTLRRQSSLR